MSQDNKAMFTLLETLAEQLNKLDTKFDSKIDSIKDNLSEMNQSIAVYNSELNRHIEGVDLARRENKILQEKYEADVAPIQEHVREVNSFFKFLKIGFGIIAAIGGLLLTLQELGLFSFKG